MLILVKSDDIRSGKKAKARHSRLGHGSQWVTGNKKTENPNFAEFLAFLGLFGIDFAILSQ